MQTPVATRHAERELVPGLRPRDMVEAKARARQVLDLRPRETATDLEEAARLHASAKTGAVAEHGRDRWGFPAALLQAYGVASLLPPNPFALQDPWRYMPLTPQDQVAACERAIRRQPEPQRARNLAEFQKKRAFLLQCFEQQADARPFARAAAKQAAIEAAYRGLSQP